MIKILVLLLIALSLVSFAPPVPHATLETGSRPFIVHRSSFVVRSQACTYATAPAKLRAQIADPSGIPFGEVSAWSCTGDGLAVAAELAQRAAEMQAEAAAYRQAHPIGGVK